MRIGIVAWWFNRGQGVVARQLRSALEALGHTTFVLGRPTPETFPLPRTASSEDVWDQPGVSQASAFEIPMSDYDAWVAKNGIEVAFFDSNYGFEEIAVLRDRGVRTIGRFVWEQFSSEHIEPAKRALDIIYSLTRAERERYRAMGIESPYLRWGCHPELARIVPDRHPSEVRFHYHAGLLATRRKPYREIVEAFSRTTDSSLRLIVKAQVEQHMEFFHQALADDPRIELVIGDLPTDEHLQLFADCHVCLAPARWEGLGLHLFEALAFGMPIVTNDKPPMSELVDHNESGILIGSHPDGSAKSGITAWAPDIADLQLAFERLASADLRAKLEAGTRRIAAERRWDRTIADLKQLLERVTSGAA